MHIPVSPIKDACVCARDREREREGRRKGGGRLKLSCDFTGKRGPLAMQHLLIIKTISLAHSHLAPPFHLLLRNTLLASSGDGQYCNPRTARAVREVRGFSVYKRQCSLIKSSTCWSTLSAEGPASTTTQAEPLTLR